MTQPLLLTGDSLKVQLIRAVWAWCEGKTQLPQPQSMSWMKNILVLGQPCSSAKAEPLLRQQSRQGALQPSGVLLRSNTEPLSPAPTAELPGRFVGAQQGCVAHLHPLPPQEQSKGRRSTVPIGDSGIAAVGSSVPAHISMLTRPSVTSIWRLSSAASTPQVSAPRVLSSPTVLGDCRDPAAHRHISGTSLLPKHSACWASSVFVAPSRWQLRGRLLGHQADGAGQTSVPGECQGCDQGKVGQSQGHG